MKIAFIACKDLPYIGGMEKYTEEIASRLVADGDEVTVYTSGRNSKKLTYYKGIKIRPVRTVHIKGIERLIISRLATILATFSNVDIIHYQSFENTLLTFFPKLIGKKVIYQGHGLEWERDRWGRIAIMYLKAINYIVNLKPSWFFSKGTVVSLYQRKYYLDTYNNEYVWIPTGINLIKNLRPKEITNYGLRGKDYIFFAARLVKEKGAHYLIEAYNKLMLSGRTKIFLVIAGDAEDEKDYTEMLKSKDLYNKIIFTGAIFGNKLYEFYSNSLLFVLPSTIEGMPISLLEAMSFNVPTLSSDIGPNLELTHNGKFGFHFMNRDVNDLSRMIEFIINNQGEADYKATLARNHVINKFTWEKIYTQVRELYIGLIEGKNKI